MSLRTLIAVALLATVTLAACTAAAAERTPRSLDPGAVLVTAKASRFPAEPAAAPAGTGFTLALDNLDRVPHNVVLLDASGATAFSGTMFSGPRRVAETVPALAAGTYRIGCAIHPDMAGTLVAG
jgi:plastocyanin